jgi:hygromycin-B 7''-O-kinase
MADPPAFASDERYVERRGDANFWGTHVAAALDRHDLLDTNVNTVSGARGTYPTFLVGDVVVKLFGHVPSWREGHARERAAQSLLTTHTEIAAPRLLASGSLYGGHDAEWPYLISTRMSGVAWASADLTHDQRRDVVGELGRQMRLVHAMPVLEGMAEEGSGDLDVAAAAGRSSLPGHLVAQVDDYLACLGPPDPVFTHADLTTRHVYVENGRLSGIIDWGDAAVMDRHYEIIQPYRDVCACDTALFGVFLDAYDWPVGDDFPHRALGMALFRQAHGLHQHLSMDVFEPIAALLPLDDIATLDDLAIELFDI